MTDKNSHPSKRVRLDPPAEEFLATLTDAAYQVALQHGVAGSFVDVQLDLWAALRGVLASQTPARPLRPVAVG